MQVVSAVFCIEVMMEALLKQVAASAGTRSSTPKLSLALVLQSVIG